MDQDTTLHVCSICGREFRPRDAETLICPDCGGPPEAPAPSQPQETVSSNGSQGMAQANRQVSTSPQEWQEGDVILDLYEVKGEVGRGGLAAVYRVHHRRWNMDLAVKTPLPEALQKAGSLENFLREAQAWVDLGLHPHIVTCYYVRRLGEMPRVFAECMEGGSLKNWMEDGRLYAGGEQDALKRILDCAIQFAWGLGYAHEKGLVHQDVKPANALMTPDGMLKVTDFGLVGAKGYTPAYAAPEQELGQAVSPRTDLWGWGVSVLEMFTGGVHWQFGSVAASVLENYLQEAPPEGIPPMPAALVELLRQCFQNDPDLRPASMDEVAERLARLYEQETGAPYPRQKPNALELRADSLNNKAVSLLDLGQEEEAVRCWQEALQADPLHPGATYNLFLIQWDRGDVIASEVVKRLEEQLKLSSNYWPVAYLLGLVYFKVGDSLKAIETIAKLYLPEVRDEQPFAWVIAIDRHDTKSALEILLDFSKDGKYPDVRRTLELAMLNLPDVRSLRNIKGHAEKITCVSFSPDGNFLLSGSEDNTLRLWDWLGTCKRILKGHTGAITCAAFSQDGRYILSGSHDCTVRLWDVATGECLRVFKGHTEKVTSVAFDIGRQYIASGSTDHTLKIWDIHDGSSIHTIEHEGEVSCVGFSPNGGYLVSGMDGLLTKSPIFFWDAKSGRHLYALERHEGGITSMAFTASGHFLLLGTNVGTIELWDLTTKNCQRTLQSFESWPVVSVSVHPKGDRALSCQGDSIYYWNLQTGACILKKDSEWFVASIAISPDGRFILLGCLKSMKMWKLEGIGDFNLDFFLSKPRLSEHETNIETTFTNLIKHAKNMMQEGKYSRCLELVQQARSMPGYERSNMALELWFDLHSHCRTIGLKAYWESQTLIGHNFWVWSVAASPCGRYILSASFDKTMRLWDVKRGICLHTLNIPDKTINSVAFSPSGEYIVFGGYETMQMWDVRKWKCIRVFRYEKRVDAVAFSPDGRYVVSGGWDDATIRLWEVQTGRCVCILEGHEGAITSVAVRPDGYYILSCSYDHTVRLWDVCKGVCVYVDETHMKSLPHPLGGEIDVPVNSVSFSPDGKHAVSAGTDGMMRIWNIENGKTLSQLRCKDSITSVVFHPNGRFILSGSVDGTVRIWDLETSRCVHVFSGHRDIVQSVAFSQDGCYAVSGSWDKTVRLWVLDWDLECPAPADWDEGARPYLDIFLTLHTPYAPDGLSRVGKPQWTEEDFQKLLQELGYRGYGWLRPEGVRRELEKMAKERK